MLAVDPNAMAAFLAAPNDFLNTTFADIQNKHGDNVDGHFYATKHPGGSIEYQGDTVVGFYNPSDTHLILKLVVGGYQESIAVDPRGVVIPLAGKYAIPLVPLATGTTPSLTCMAEKDVYVIYNTHTSKQRMEVVRASLSEGIWLSIQGKTCVIRNGKLKDATHASSSLDEEEEKKEENLPPQTWWQKIQLCFMQR